MKGISVSSIAFFIFLEVAILAECQENRQEFVKDLSERQKEFFSHWEYLKKSEKEAADKLNKGIDLYNQDPSLQTAQRIEDLKIEIIDNLQEQIKNDREYIAYLEVKMSEILDSGPSTTSSKEAIEEIKEKTKIMEEAPPSPSFKESIQRIKKKADKLMEHIAPVRFGEE